MSYKSTQTDLSFRLITMTTHLEDSALSSVTSLYTL